MSDPVNVDLPSEVRAMTATVADLAAKLNAQNDALDTQNESLDRLSESQRKLRRFARWLAGLYALDILLIMGTVITFAVVLAGLSTVTSSNAVSVTEQCFDKGLLLSTYRPEGPAPGSAIPPDRYQDLYRQLQDSADRLGCGIPHKVP